ncbi:dihydrofolate reductase [Oceanobacillus piezotolerans]|uniref:Dihydrofolate reductase n=1 Tax=Oceanobacillus piezotolerans TaxID=2448030 RepID=A0A498DTR3_9BACI|nr:dihydrofolate reductase [Oceanobacillus piezotolerans]RLL48247.1 dihydrofolate reductase [Oceanobacillus piezotolerans]
MISLLFAMDRNRVIGLNNDLPWHLPKDLQFFKRKTTGNTIVMGRKTFDSIGKALPNRRNVVLTSQKDFAVPNVEVIHDLEIFKAWNKSNPDEEYFVIGGAHLFEQILDIADRMYVTFIDEEFEGDTYFPAFNEQDFKMTSKEQGEKDDKNPYDYYFIQYDRT